MNDKLLYDSLKIAETIKVLSKRKNIALRVMLNDIGMGFNSMSHMRHGRMPSAENLAKLPTILIVRSIICWVELINPSCTLRERLNKPFTLPPPPFKTP